MRVVIATTEFEAIAFGVPVRRKIRPGLISRFP